MQSFSVLLPISMKANNSNHTHTHTHKTFLKEAVAFFTGRVIVFTLMGRIAKKVYEI